MELLLLLPNIPAAMTCNVDHVFAAVDTACFHVDVAYIFL